MGVTPEDSSHPVFSGMLAFSAVAVNAAPMNKPANT